jgi:phosphoglycerate dehydrogenase-like enzyme
MSLKFVMLPPHSKRTHGWPERLAVAMPDWKVVAAKDEAEAKREIADADAAYGRDIPIELLRSAKRLRWLQAPMSAPPAGYYYPELVAHPVVVTNMRETFSDHIGAHIMSFVLAFSRGLHRYVRHQLQRDWAPLPQGQGIVHLAEATALIVGVGGAGSEAARLAAQFGMKVIGIDPRRESPPPGVAELYKPDALDRLLPRADFVIMTAPHTPQTEDMFDRARFRRMKKTAFFINTGRGKTTRLDDLAAAIEAGDIAGAGIDVFEQTPLSEMQELARDAKLPKDHPLWTLPGVLITPHVASSGPYIDERRFQVLLDNCHRFAKGEPLRFVVDKGSWY